MAKKAESAGLITSRFARVCEAMKPVSKDGIEIMAAAAIEAYPEPSKEKEDRGKAKADDRCALFAHRGEFAELCAALDAVAEKFPRAHKLAIALREQGVVR